MRISRFNVALFAAAFASFGCSKSDNADSAVSSRASLKPATSPLVAESERSPHFTAVSKELELGGALYGYVDVDGDVAKLGTGLRGMLEQIAKAQPQAAPFVRQDFPAIFKTLGLTDVVAAGVSSVQDGPGFYRNRAFFYVPGERHGLLGALGGKSGPFTHLSLAPDNVDLYGETELDLPVAYRAIKDAATQVGGATASNAIEDGLKKTGDAITFSLLDLVQQLKGRAAIVARLSPEKPMRLPGPGGLALPGISLLVCVDGVGSIVEGALTRSKAFTAKQEGAVHYYELAQPLPLDGIKPVVAIDGSTLYFSTAREFLDECRSGQGARLAQNAEFKQALAQVGTEGNGLGYISPRLFQHVRQIETLNPEMTPDVKNTVQMVLANLPAPTRAMISVRTNRPDGILVRSYWDRSLKQDVAVLALYNPVTVGMLAAMAIPAFQKVRASSQEKAVQNNLRMLGAAAEQFRLERRGKAPALADLVGPDKLIRTLEPVAGEDYGTLRFVLGAPLRVRLGDGRMVELRQ